MRDEIFGRQNRVNTWDEVTNDQILFVINYSQFQESIEVYGISESENLFGDDKDVE